jgi:hypothetical protein
MADESTSAEEWKPGYKTEPTFVPTSQDGDVGGYSIDRQIKVQQVGAGAASWHVDVNFGIWLGSEQFATAPFRVDMKGNITATTLSASSLKYGKTSFADSTNAGFWIDSSGVYFGSAGNASYLKYTIGGNLSLVGGVIDSTTTIGGRLASTIAAALDASGHFADSAINTATNTIIGSFTFTPATGALQIGTYVNGVSGDIRISQNGILGRDMTGATTFSVDGTTGVAVLNGLVVGTNVGIGTAQTAGQVTTIVGNTVTTSYVNALNITVLGTVTAGAINGLTITGGTIQTGAVGSNRLAIAASESTTNIFWKDTSNINRAWCAFDFATSIFHIYTYDTTTSIDYGFLINGIYGRFYCSKDGSELGDAAHRWYLWTNGANFGGPNYYTFNLINQTIGSGTLTCNKYLVLCVNGAAYKLPCVAA